MENDQLEAVDLFSYSHWPWSSTDMPDNYRDLSPSLYVGMFNKQLYIQESEHLRKIIHSSIMGPVGDPLAIDFVRKKYLRIPWKPIAVGGAALNLIKNDKMIEGPADDEDDVEVDKKPVTGAEVNPSITALSVLYASEYVNGNGFYLHSPIDLIGNDTEQLSDNANATFDGDMDENSFEFQYADADTPVQVVIVSLWYWW